jgi:hypothetical protein
VRATRLTDFLPAAYVTRLRKAPNCGTPTGMDDAGLRGEVIARLMMRHGLTAEEAGLAWEHYLLSLRAKQRAREGAAADVEHN